MVAALSNEASLRGIPIIVSFQNSSVVFRTTALLTLIQRHAVF
jgi:hypothetical protein